MHTCTHAPMHTQCYFNQLCMVKHLIYIIQCTAYIYIHWHCPTNKTVERTHYNLQYTVYTAQTFYWHRKGNILQLYQHQSIYPIYIIHCTLYTVQTFYRRRTGNKRRVRVPSVWLSRGPQSGQRLFHCNQTAWTSKVVQFCSPTRKQCSR